MGLLLADEYSSIANALPSGDDPAAMLDGRLSAFPRGKRIKVGTPEIEGNCRLSAEYEESDQRQWHIACPECGHEQPLVWSGLMWTPDLKDAWYVCCDCAAVIREYQKTALIAAGGWVPAYPERKRRGYRANGLYYPVGLGPSWLDLAREYVTAIGDEAKMKTFTNDRLAVAYVMKGANSMRSAELRDRCEPYRLRFAPAPVLAITAGVDTQDDRLEVQILGWGRGMKPWTLDYAVLDGDPTNDEVWNALTELLNRPIEHASGALLRVEASAIDMGGHRTEDVKHYVRQRCIRRAMAIFGARSPNAPVLGRPKLADIKRGGSVDHKGVQVWQVGGIEITHRLYAWLGADAKLPLEDRRVHFSDELSDAFLGGILSEVWDPRKGRYVPRRGAPRNEPLDTWKYAYAAACHPDLRLHRATAAFWDAREKAIAEMVAQQGGQVASRAAALPGPAAQAPAEPAAPDHPAAITTAATPAPVPAHEHAPPAAVAVRSVLFELVNLAQRNAWTEITPAHRARWSAAVASHPDEAGLHGRVMEAVSQAATVGEALGRELLEHCHRYLAGQPVAIDRPRQQRPARRVRSRGL